MLKQKIKKALNKLFGYSSYSNASIKCAADFINARNIEGDYFEFGVYNGDSFSYAYHQLNNGRASMMKHHVKNNLAVPETLQNRVRYFAFDSFQGLPKVTDAERSKLPSHWQEGQYSSSAENFRKNIKQNRVDMKDVVVVQGWFSSELFESAKALHKIEKGCLFHIDCDLYESTKIVLEFIKDLYVDGSILIFDDWFGFKGNPDFGEQRAFREWKEKYNIRASEFRRDDGQRVSFILHK